MKPKNKQNEQQGAYIYALYINLNVTIIKQNKSIIHVNINLMSINYRTKQIHCMINLKQNKSILY